MALPLSSQPSTIHLDYGADSAPFDSEDLQVCPRGLCLRSRWCFDAGTEIAINFQIHEQTGAPPRLLRTEGIVVDCELDEGAPRSEREAGSVYRLTLVFLEETDDIRLLIGVLGGIGTRSGALEPAETWDDE